MKFLFDRSKLFVTFKFIASQFGFGLSSRRVQLSYRIYLMCYTYENGKPGSYDVVKVNIKGYDGKLAPFDNLREISFPPPPEVFDHILVPSPEGYTQKMGFYRWGWTADGRFLVAMHDASNFYFDRSEVDRLRQELFPAGVMGQVQKV
jgi:hypothetical protein